MVDVYKRIKSGSGWSGMRVSHKRLGVSGGRQKPDLLKLPQAHVDLYIADELWLQMTPEAAEQLVGELQRAIEHAKRDQEVG